MTFLPEPTQILAFVLAAVVLTLTPGPDMTLFVGRTLAQGRAAGLAAMLGAAFGVLVHTTLAALGLSALVAASPDAFLVLKVVGAGYLAFLAVQAIRSGSAFNFEAESNERRGTLVRNWLTGFGINLLNPKVVLFFVTFLPQFVTAGDPFAGRKLFFLGVTFIAVAVPMSLAMILTAERFAAALKRRPRMMRIMDYLFASVFSAFAARILLART